MTEAGGETPEATGSATSFMSALFPPRKLIPAESIAGRALVTVIAIMTFLAALTAGSATLIFNASQEWTSLVSSEMTIQIKPAIGRDLDKDSARAVKIAEAHPGIASVKPMSAKESARLLEPWLGAGLDLKELPIPRLIVIRQTDSGADLVALAKTLRKDVPNAVLDNHRLWVERLASVSRALLFAALCVLLLVLVSMTLAVSFATRGAMAGNREIIDVLHFVGAEDRYIAREFQRHFLVLGFKGGLAGGLAAIVAFAIIGYFLSGWIDGPGGDAAASLFGTFALGWSGYLAIGFIALAMALLTAAASRIAVSRHLSGLL